MASKQFLMLAFVSILLIFLTAQSGKQAVSAAAVSLYIESSQSGSINTEASCGNGLCEGSEASYCISDCPHIESTAAKQVFTIKLIHVLIILLIVIATVFAGLLLRERYDNSKNNYNYYSQW